MTNTPSLNLLAVHAGEVLDALAGQLETAGVSRATTEQARDARRAVVAELTEDPDARQTEIEALAGTLEPPEVIRHAEQLIRQRYPVLHPLHRIWGTIADEMNSASHIPELTAQRPRDIRQFNRNQALAWAIIDIYHGRTGREGQET